MILLETCTKKLPQVNWHVLFYCTNDVCSTKYYKCYWKTLPIKRNPFPAENQTLRLSQWFPTGVPFTILRGVAS